MGWLTQAHLWSVLGAPVCALFVARTAYAFSPAPLDTAGAKPVLLVSLCLASGLTVALIDLRLMVTPVRASLALVAAGLVVSWLSVGALYAAECAAAAAAGWLFFRALDLIYLRLRGRSGLGEGDALLAAALGAWLSFEGLAWSVAVGGLLTLFFVLALGRTRVAQAFPFAPGLALGAYLVVLVTQAV
jgi:leader peptidase (prepilin peptidase) / N-methyltransferase